MKFSALAADLRKKKVAPGRRPLVPWATAMLLCLSIAAIFDQSLGNPWLRLKCAFSSYSDLPSTCSPLSHPLPPSPLHALQANGSWSNGLTAEVEWDQYSLIVKKQRVFIWSGEFHTWRLPVPELWRDVIQKIKAAGFNAISVYVHWGLVNPSRGVFDFNGYRSLQPLFDASKEAGLWVVLRPGPYINAETTAGGIPHWVTSEVAGHLRTNASSYAAAWKPYIQEIARLARPNQISSGGPIVAVQIDNEYIQDPSVGYPGKAEMMWDIEEDLRKGGIVVPLTYNDAYQGKNFVNGLGAVDLYGLDSYPQRFDCSNPSHWNPVVENYFDFHTSTNPKQPFYSPEFQAGSFDAWGPSSPGYQACHEMTGTNFESVFYKNLLAANFKMVNLYMIYGGTSWGHLPFPGVYTSYDYGAAISESREIGSPKYAEVKRQAMFLRSTPEFYKTGVIGNSSRESGVVHLYGGSPIDAFVTLLRNPDTGAQFYIARQLNSTSTFNSRFKLEITTSLGRFLIPQTSWYIALVGRESKIICTDLSFGASSHLLYTTASILWSGTLGGRDALFLFGEPSQGYEAAIKFKQHNSAQGRQDAFRISEIDQDHSLVTFSKGITGLITVWDSPEQIVLYADAQTAGTCWFPTVSSPSSASNPFSNYWQFGTNETVLVGGPYLVRSAELSEDHSALSLRGDLNDSVRLILIGLPPSVRRLTWNDQPIEADFRPSSSVRKPQPSVVEADISFRSPFSTFGTFDPPKLIDWKYADSLPEINEYYLDRDWVVANRTFTNIPYKPYGNGTVLYGCDYGLYVRGSGFSIVPSWSNNTDSCEGIVLFRGHFNSTGNETSVTLAINGGAGFACSVWLNDYFLGTSYGNSSNNQNVISETNQTFLLPGGAVKPGDNVVTVVQDNMGLEQTEDWDADTSKSPRGIRYYHLEGASFSFWRIQGKKGGYSSFTDTHRGVLNEGGSFGERQGWHLPEFDTSSWVKRDFNQGLPNGKAGLGFFVTTFDLKIPEGYDIPMSFVFDADDQPYRAILFVNGWMMGKRIANLGPQFKFPVHEGILNYRSRNTVAILLWSMEDQPLSPKVSLAYDAIYDGGISW